MSEYQYYEFRAIDRPLDKRAMGELRAMSDRAIDLGLDREFSACLRQIQTRLATDPLDWFS